MVLFTPITTVIFEGVKLRDSLFPTSCGRMIWTVPDCVEVELVVVVVEDALVDDLLLEEDERLLDVVVVDVVLVDALVVVGRVEVAVDEVCAVEDDGCAEVETVDALVLVVLLPREEEVEPRVCVEVAGGILIVVVVSCWGWRKNSAANAPATRIRISPDTRATVERRPVMPAGFLAGMS